MENLDSVPPVAAPVASPAVPVSTAQVPLDFRVIAVGRAGLNALELLVGEGITGVQFAAVHTDPTALARSSAPVRLHLGGGPGRGLGAGGDPALGRAAAEREVAGLRQLVAGARVVFLLTGLGAGTGSGAAPVVARIARESGALVLGITTLPFDCEGNLRRANAAAGLQDLRAAADAVICVPNQRVLQTLDERTPATEVFAAANELLAEGVRGLWRLLTRPGLIQLDFANLERLLRGRHAESVFAVAQARGEHRAREVVERLLANPFLAQGDILAASDAVLINVTGGPDLTFSELERVLSQLQRHCEQAQVVVGTAIEDGLSGGITVTVVASRGGSAPLPEASPTTLEADAHGGTPRGEGPPADDEFLTQGTGASRASSRLVPPAPDLTQAQRQSLVGMKRGLGKRKKAVQTTFNFDVMSRGRFEKTEATVLHGQDLDIPTFLRRGIALN